jgi:hypothetical protein
MKKSTKNLLLVAGVVAVGVVIIRAKAKASAPATAVAPTTGPNAIVGGVKATGDYFADDNPGY